MNLLSHKSKENSLGTLDEKQIQERLYGKYHKGNHPNAAPQVRTEPPAISPKGLTPPPKKIELYQEWKALSHEWAEAFNHFAKGFPWKVVGSIGIALIASVLVAQNVGQWLANWNSLDSDKEFRQTSQGPESSKLAVRAAPAPVKKALLPQELSRSEGIVSPTLPVVKQKHYAVQVCTYQRTKDAEELVKQLQALHFSAFYKQSASREERIPLYVVFLDRAETYAQAKAQLDEFRKTALFQKFSDSFILSL